ncbi:hypothetical protein AB0G74_27695 [Streptomyces sp. NPDC020875]|uniref:hypothetical protein n=1 Tax=Streptomyces sp. NPDC020875 TaxID=3154898 RepID=UPI00340CB548
MTIMPSDLPMNHLGVAEELTDAMPEVFPLFEQVQKMARLGVNVQFTVAPSTIIATITVAPDAATVLPALLAEIDNVRPVKLESGRLAALGEMLQGTVTMRVVIPEGWVTQEELAVLTGAAAADPSALL